MPSLIQFIFVCVQTRFSESNSLKILPQHVPSLYGHVYNSDGHTYTCFSHERNQNPHM